MKYKGVFVGASYFLALARRLRSGWRAPGRRGDRSRIYVQAAFYPVKKKLELYGATSWVFGDKDAGFETQHEYLGGVNWFIGRRETSGSTVS